MNEKELLQSVFEEDHALIVVAFKLLSSGFGVVKTTSWVHPLCCGMTLFTVAHVHHSPADKAFHTTARHMLVTRVFFNVCIARSAHKGTAR